MALRDQYYPGISELIEAAEEEYETGADVEKRKVIPPPDKIPQRNNKWLKIENVISVFVDMKGSTELSAAKKDKSTAEIYQFFTNTMVRILSKFGASYIDVKGDGVFGLFNPNMPHTAFSAAVTCKTFCAKEFSRRVKSKRDVSLSCHIGVDQKTVLVKRVGIEPRGGDDSHLRNEVWAGKPVNMSAKLAAEADGGQVMVSDRFYRKLTNNHAKYSCDCGEGRTLLWQEIDVEENKKFDFRKAYLLSSNWCEKHGREYCSDLVRQEKEDIREAVESSAADSFLLGK